VLPTIEKFRYEEVIQDNQRKIFLKGTIDEDTNFAPLLKPGGALILNFSGVTAINSLGIRSWVNFLKDVGDTHVVYEECPPLIVRQMNMVPSFLGKSQVASVFIPYICDECENEKIVLVTEDKFKGGQIQVQANLVCDKCQKGEMEFDGQPKQYFAFVK
jgi:hypothetical protein